MITERQRQAYLQVLHYGFVMIRDAAGAGDSKKAREIADALENLPSAMLDPAPFEWSHETFVKDYIQTLLDEYPDLGHLRVLLDA